MKFGPGQWDWLGCFGMWAKRISRGSLLHSCGEDKCDVSFIFHVLYINMYNSNYSVYFSNSAR